MEAQKVFEVGDLVWAKMKGFPFWPSKIVEPPASAKSTNSKKAQHYVYFFGSENHAWILDENIVHHSNKMLESSTSKKKLATYKLAIDQITKESLLVPKNVKLPVKEEELPKESEVSNTSNDKKPIKITKPKIKSIAPKVQKKIAPKRGFFDESPNKYTSPPRKFAKKSEDYSALLSNTPPNIGYNRVAVIKPLEDHSSFPSSGIASRVYYELPPIPSLKLKATNEYLLNKDIKPTKKKIGFIGLGMIGQRLVKNLITTGHDVTVYNRTTEKCEGFLKIGASSVQTPSEVVEKCDIIFCCVSGPASSKTLVFGNFGILAGLENASPKSKGYVEITTMDAETSETIALAITHKGGKYLEAQVNGSRKMAEDIELIILGAGDQDLFNDCESCFKAMSKHTYFLGNEVGLGSKLNLILSMLIGVSNAALAEAIALLERCKLSLPTFLEILDLGPLSCDLYKEKGHAIMQRNFTTNTSLKYQQNDLNLALSMGNKCVQPMILTAAANELFKHAKLLRYSEHDVSAVYLGAKY